MDQLINQLYQSQTKVRLYLGGQLTLVGRVTSPVSVQFPGVFSFKLSLPGGDAHYVAIDHVQTVSWA